MVVNSSNKMFTFTFKRRVLLVLVLILISSIGSIFLYQYDILKSFESQSVRFNDQISKEVVSSDNRTAVILPSSLKLTDYADKPKLIDYQVNIFSYRNKRIG